MLHRCFISTRFLTNVIACAQFHTQHASMGRQKDKKPSVPKDNEKHISKKLQARLKQKRFEEESIEVEDVSGRVPTDDVWLRKYYPTPEYSLDQCIEMHRQFAQPAMLNNMNGTLKFKCTLDMSTNKKTRFMGPSIKTVFLPNYYDAMPTNSVVAFCKDSEDFSAAENAGAAFVGGISLVKTILKGDIHPEEFDHVVCSLDMFQELSVIRKIIKDLMPQKSKGNLGEDMGKMVKHFLHGIPCQVTKDHDETTGYLTMGFSQLDMEDNKIHDNFDTMLEEISLIRTHKLSKPFFKEAFILCPPSPEQFKLNLDSLFESEEEEELSATSSS